MTNNSTEKHQKILSAAMKCVAEKGFQRSTTAEIAKEAEVGEGTLYRYFTSKDELLEATAYYAGQKISDGLQSYYDVNSSLFQQYVSMCTGFLKEGLHDPTPSRFLEQFRNSPQGIVFKKNRISEVLQNKMERPFFYPLNIIILQAMKQGLLKEYPFQVLASLTIGPLLFILKDSLEGLLEMDEDLMKDVATACWDSIKK